MKMKLLITTSLALIAVSGCSLFPTVKPLEVNTIALPAPMYHPPLPMEIQATEVLFEVLTPEIMEEYLQLVKDGKAPAVAYYALTTTTIRKPFDEHGRDHPLHKEHLIDCRVL
jgi:hypothetical protein